MFIMNGTDIAEFHAGEFHAVQEPQPCRIPDGSVDVIGLGGVGGAERGGTSTDGNIEKAGPFRSRGGPTYFLPER